MKKNIFFILFVLLIQNTFSQCFTNAGGFTNTIGVKSNHTIWGCGFGSYGQLNNGTDGNDEYLFIQLSPTTDWQFVIGDYLKTFAIKNNGTLWGCGSNLYGQLGINSTNINSFQLVQIGSANNWKEVSSGSGFTIGLKTNGTIWGCGHNNFGQMGQGSSGSNQLTFIQIGTATDWKTVAANGASSAFGIKNNGTLWGWGLNTTVLSPTILNTPTQLDNATDWDKVAMGVSHVVMLKTNGTIFSWGNDFFGETGSSSGGSTISFANQILGPWIAIGAGNRTSFGIKTNGTLWAWGWNEYGQLGIGGVDSNIHYIPSQVGSATNWVSVDGGDIHTVALRSDGSLWSWGNNDYGQLGNGTTTPSYSPANVVVAGCSLANTNFVEKKMVLVVYPNPSDKEVTINYKGIENIDTIEFIDSLGKLVYSTPALSNNSFSTTLNLPNLQSGTYIVVLKNKNTSVVSEKLIIK